MTHATQEAGEWAVFDMNATIPDPNAPGKIKPRVHDAAPGHRYHLTCDVPCFMPQAHARVFLKDPAFRVVDADGKEIASLNKDLLSRLPPETLAEDQVIANVNELTNEALLTRVTQRPGGTKFSDQTARQALIDFLIDGFAAGDVTDESDPTGEEFTPKPIDTSLMGA